jgi:hypothetical protein
MDQAAIAIALFEAAEKYAKGRGVRFGQGTDADFRRYADSAATEISAFATDQQTARINAAKLSFERLIDEMIFQAKGIPGYPSDVIGERTLEKALSVLCPLWPFC